LALRPPCTLTVAVGCFNYPSESPPTLASATYALDIGVAHAGAPPLTSFPWTLKEYEVFRQNQLCFGFVALGFVGTGAKAAYISVEDRGMNEAHGRSYDTGYAIRNLLSET